jgi:hypothetical protein
MTRGWPQGTVRSWLVMASLSPWRVWATLLIAAVTLAVIPYGATADSR